MTKAEELINKHLDRLNANNIIGKDGNIYKGFLNAVNEALTIPVVVDMLPSKNSKDFKGWLKSEGYKSTGFGIYQKENKDYCYTILYKHYCNVLEFGN